MTQHFSALGLDRDAAYHALAQRFRPIFARIRAGALQREQQRELLHVPLHWLREVRFGALRVPVASGGYGATLPQLFALLTELAAADSNITQALRAHFGFVESLLASDDAVKQQRWFTRLAEGDWVGNAWSEPGSAKQSTFSTTVLPHGAGFVLNGEKFYTTGSLYADWINIGASDEHQVWVGVTVNRHHPGVEVVDDWNGFGQRLTASGTTRFHQVPVAAEDISRHDASATTSDPAFYQLVHLATLTGIGQAAAEDIAVAVRERERSYSHGNAARAAQDPQILQIVGKVHSGVWAAQALVQQSTQELDYARQVRGQPELADAANQQAELAVAQAQTVVSALILDAVGLIFDALGASATSVERGLDRYWRNARTLVSHNPRVYKERIVGDFVVNGQAPPYQWRIGTV
jgi:alkylation response protein AidB-like acyl-CoA dehydrogenase